MNKYKLHARLYTDDGIVNITHDTIIQAENKEKAYATIKKENICQYKCIAVLCLEKIEDNTAHSKKKTHSKEEITSRKLTSETLEEWKLVSGKLFNQIYEATGPNKHEIEDMCTDIEYEACIVDCVMYAWLKWNQEDKLDFFDLVSSDKYLVVKIALEHKDTKYGWYRGDLPHDESIRDALIELGVQK